MTKHTLTRAEWKLLDGCSLDYPITRTPHRIPMEPAKYASPEGKPMSELCVERLVKAGIIEPVPDDMREALIKGGQGVVRYVFTDRGLTTWQNAAAEFDPNLKRKGARRRPEGKRA